MRTPILVVALLSLAACGKTETPKVEDVAANNMSNDEVTEVPDDSAQANLVDQAIGGGNNTTIVDPD